MRPITFLCCFIFCFTNSIFAQEEAFSSGLIMDDEVYEQQIREPRFDGSKYTDFPLKVDLKKYAPFVASQGNIESCVGWATGYGALTIERAIKHNLTDQKKITYHASSGMFIYNQIKRGEHCGSGARIADAMEFLTSKGTCLARDFNINVNDCAQYPNQQLQQAATEYKVADYMTLFGINDDPQVKVMKVQKALANKKPVVIGMKVRRNFYKLSNTKFWWPNNGNTTNAGGHAMVVVGYDETKAAFQLMNSWGTQWGDQGFIWVKYKDFGTFCKYAYVLHMNAPSQQLAINKRTIATSPKAPQNIKYENQNSREIQGSAKLNQNKSRSQPSNNQPTIQQRQQQTNSNTNPQPQYRNQQPNQPTQNRYNNNSSNSSRVSTPNYNPNNQNNRYNNSSNNNRSNQNSRPNNNPNYSQNRSTPNPPNRRPNNTQSRTQTRPTQNNTPPLSRLAGSFNFKYLDDEMSTDQIIFRNADVRFDGQKYKMNRTDWELGQFFQLAVSSAVKNEYIYVFSSDMSGKINIHWPRQEGLSPKFKGMNESALVTSRGSEITIPGKNKGMKLTQKGTEHLCILFSSRKIDNIKEVCDYMKDKKGTFVESINELLASYFIPKNEIQYAPDRIQFSSNSTNGFIVPVIVELEAR